MDSRIYKIAEKFLSVIKRKYKGDYTDVPGVLAYWHNITFLFFSSINHQRLFRYKNENYGEMIAWGLMPEYLYKFYEDNKMIIGNSIDVALEEYSFSDMNLNSMRQAWLNIELDFTDDEVGLFSDKISRDNTGAYYTPGELAFEIIKKSFAGRNFAASRDYRIADFSCGGGDFFIAIMEYLEEKYGIKKNVSVKWFYGIDIDPIALQICMVSLLAYADRKDWQSVISHFIFGNPLVMSSSEYSEKEKNILFATRRLYSTGLGMPKTFFDSTFDVVIGNPPWEKIRFE